MIRMGMSMLNIGGLILKMLKPKGDRQELIWRLFFSDDDLEHFIAYSFFFIL